ncbi:DNA-directed RNA polymerase I subunit rpa49-like [Vicia villosa]|uniref:DNA-directed RNA polymerase I subunit rpa49-like n=1 Tax=Vicia villosa TaxID=3911 RepID=UPI00273C0F53|nr:DNA-directed RNA polymerase I subunit rpa49-like [Vicia villosa]
MEHSPKSTKKAKHKKKVDTEPPPEPVREPVKVKVEVVRSDPEKMPPFVGYFPSGFDPVKQSSGSAGAGIQVYRNQFMNKRTELVVSPADSSVEFVGTSYAGEATGQRGMYALGVFDKESQTLKVVSIGANKIFRLEPRVKGLEYKEPLPSGTPVEEMTQDEWTAKRRLTDATFGTKRHIEMNLKFAEIRRDEEPEAKKNLDEKMKNVEVKEIALANTDAHIARHIPPYDTSATTPREAYVLDKIILSLEWNHLQDIYYLLPKGEEADFSGYPTFIRNRIGKVKKIEDESEKKKLCCILSFINYLVKFKDQHTMDGVSSSKNYKIPPILNNRFSTLFEVSETRRLPPEKINLLVSYVLVLTLFTDEFHTDYKDIAKDLRMTIPPVRQLFEHLGCKFLKEKGIFHATLPMPLTFPRINSKRKKRN